MDNSIQVLATNRRASFDYFLEDRFEAGLALLGSEIKSVRARQISLQEAYVDTNGREAWLVNAHIAAYDPASRQGHEPLRRRKLLLHRKEILRIHAGIRQRGYTLVPTRLYLKRGRAKLEFALARGKRKYDKRQSIAAREAARDISRQRGKTRR